MLTAARSVLDAIRQAFDIDCFIVEDMQFSRIIGEEAVLVAVNEILNGKENILIGASIVENNKIDGVIKATLNAINRKICLLVKE